MRLKRSFFFYFFFWCLELIMGFFLFFSDILKLKLFISILDRSFENHFVFSLYDDHRSYSVEIYGEEQLQIEKM